MAARSPLLDEGHHLSITSSLIGRARKVVPIGRRSPADAQCRFTAESMGRSHERRRNGGFRGVLTREEFRAALAFSWDVIKDSPLRGSRAGILRDDRIPWHGVVKQCVFSS
jgi:hypothetical protein